MELDPAKFARLREAAAKSDEDILGFARQQEGGVTGLLDDIFDGMPLAFQPERAKGQHAEFQYEINTPDGVHEYFVRVREGGCETGRGRVTTPKLTTMASLPTFLRLATGRINGMQAFLRGKVKLAGNTLYAGKFEHWFERPSA